MVWVSTFSLVFAALLVLEIFIRKSDFFSPVRIFLLSHAVGTGVAFLSLDRAMTPFRPFTILVYLGSGICFVLGAWVIRLLGGPADRDPVRPPAFDPRRYNWNVHLAFSAALLLFFLWGMLGAYRLAGEFPLLAESKGKAFLAFAKNGYYTLGFNYAGVVMALFFMSIFRPTRLPAILNPGFWITTGVFLIFSLVLSRVSLMFFVFFALVFFHEGVRRISFPRLAAVFVLCFSIVLVTGYYKTRSLGQEHSIKTEKLVALALKIPYMYIANNYWNLDHALNREDSRALHPTTYGFAVLQGFFDLIPGGGGSLGGILRADTRIDDQFNKSSVKVRGWNTILYPWALYKDFGLPGVFLGTFLVGASLGLLYLRMRRRPTALNLAAYSFLAFFIYNSLFGFFLEAPNYASGFAYVCLCCYLAQTMVQGKHVLPGDVSGTAPATGSVLI